LDGLRGVSILGVIWFHTWFGTPQDHWLQSVPILRNGWFGVEIFFTISGFFITTLLLREREKYGEISLKGFYIRRSLRIWPLYYASLGLYVMLVLILEHGTARGQAFFHYLPAYLTYTYTWFGPRGNEPGAIFHFGWSLSVEEQFYIFWPLVIKLLRWPAAILMLVGIIALRIAGGFDAFSQFMSPDSLSYRILTSISVPICLGALLALLLHQANAFKYLYSILGQKWSSPVALMALLVCLVPTSQTWMALTWIILPLFIGACVIREDHGIAEILKFRPLAFIGMVSYGMYLFNTLVVKAVRPGVGHLGLHNPLLVFPFTVGVTIFLAWFSYRYFESAFLALKVRFSASPTAAAEIAVLPSLAVTPQNAKDSENAWPEVDSEETDAKVFPSLLSVHGSFVSTA